MHDFEWFRERLEVARDNGPDDFHANCPACGSSDALHVTRKNGRALVKCFSCGGSYNEVVPQMEDAEGSEGAPEGPADETSPVTTGDESDGMLAVTRRGRRASPGGAQGTPAGDVGSTPTASTISPLDWLAERCGLTREQLDALDLPLSEENGAVVFELPYGRKLRWISDAKKKQMAWHGPTAPFWPIPDSPGEEVVVCEGEADCIVLRASSIEAYTVTGGAGTEIPLSSWEYLRRLGVQHVRVLFDEDKAGRQGAESAVEGAREAGLRATRVSVEGLNPLAGEKDVRDIALHLGYPVKLVDAVNEDSPIPLKEVKRVPREPLLLGKVHATEHTILFGDGGTGKGVIAAWWIAQLTRGVGEDVQRPMRVLIVDYEKHAQHEWQPRIEDFGGDVTMVDVMQPVRPIWEVAEFIRDEAVRLGSDLIVVDSVAYACVGLDVEQSATAIKYSDAIARLRHPVLSLAHVTKTDMDPDHPFGSIFWSNGARVTIAVSRQTQSEPDSPRVLRNPKTNQQHNFRSVAVDWTWLYRNSGAGCEKEGRGHTDTWPHYHLHEGPAFKTDAEAIRHTAEVFGADHVTEDLVEQETGRRPTAGNIRKVLEREEKADIRPTRRKRGQE